METATTPWSRPLTEILAGLETTRTGLGSSEAAAILGRTGPNQLDATRQASAVSLLARQFTSPILLILLGATVLSGILGDLIDAAIIVTIIGLSGLLGFWQEHSAGRAMVALLRLVAVTATVVRDGAPVEIPLSDVVPGDVSLLSAGDLVPGDCLILESHGLTVDESVLTGETFPVEKTPGVCPDDAVINQRTNMLFLGTHVSSGSGTVVVVSTGQDTEIGGVAHHLNSTRPPTGFERGMTDFGLLLTRIMAVLVITIFVINLLLDRPVIDSALFSLALAVGLTPQLLPAIVSISLAQGARAMAREQVIVRRLDAIEDFGSMNVLCSDKTGTMTEGHVRLSAALDLTGSSSAEVERLAHLNAELQIGLRNPIDDAIIEVSTSDIGPAVKLDEIPYDFDRKRLSVLLNDNSIDPAPLMVTKGALASVLDVCTEASGPDGATVPIEGVRAEVNRQFESLSVQGFRVLGLATRRLEGRASVSVADETGMRLIGLLTFADPAKTDAAATLRRIAESGVSVRMLTGDNHLVAAHIANAVGLDARCALTGRDLDAIDESELIDSIRSVVVFSELNPMHKERIVRALRAGGDVVGYLGDGINDAPALQAADVGISVNTAVAVAKQSAAIVLLDKDLNVLLDGLNQGRRTFANTMKYIFMTTSANFGNMLSMAVAAAALPFLPLLAGQILLINLLTDLPGTTIATDSVDPAQLKRPQHWNIRLIRNYMLVFGALSSLFDLATFALLRLAFRAAAPEFRSAWFLGSVITEVVVLFALRTRGPFFRSRPSPWVVGSSIVVVVVTAALPYTPLADPFQLVTIPVSLTAFVVILAFAYFVSTEAVKRLFWRRANGYETANA